MRIYIAGKLSTESERKFLEEISKLCEESGFETFLPHRDAGIVESINDVNKIFELDIKKGFEGCNLIIASLNGLHVGAGTAWELGYSYAKKIPAIGIKTDEPVEDALEYLSSILIASMEIVNSLEVLKKRLEDLKNN